MGPTYHASHILRFIIVCLLKPLQEGPAGLPHFLAHLLIDVLVADTNTPLSQDVFFQNIDLVQGHGNLGVSEPDEALDAIQQSFLVLLGRL